MGNRNQSKLCEIFYAVKMNLAILCPSKEMKTNRQLVCTRIVINHLCVILGFCLLMCKMSLILCSFYYMRAALKAMPPVLWCWPTVSETEIDGVAVQAEASLQYPVMCCCRMALWQQIGGLVGQHLAQKCIWSKGVELNSSMRKNTSPVDIHWCLLNAYGDHTVDVNTVRVGAVFDRGWPPLVEFFTSVACRLLFTAGENALLMVLTMLK